MLAMSPAAAKKRGRTGPRSERGKSLRGFVESDLIRRVSYEEYRDKVRDVYSGPQGAFLATASLLSLHAPLGERMFRRRKFDLSGVRSVLDIGSGAGQIAKHLIKYADPGARVVCFDLSPEMLRRARNRMKTDDPRYVAGDLARLPFADGSFDCVTCGYVLEHLPDPRVGLTEAARVLTPGGRMLLLTTEDSFSGAWTSRLWRCRTYNRGELMEICQSLGLAWKQELWFTRMHRAIRAGGICVEIEKTPAA
jgi:ubiquinone/menaquinone biosynthesis C-methylase UbiE